MPAEIEVEVVYATPERQRLLVVRVAQGSTVDQAIHSSGILEQFPEIDLAVNKVGVFGRICPLSRVLEAGERVEIYRPLIADPKEVRRRLAAEGRSIGAKSRKS